MTAADVELVNKLGRRMQALARQVAEHHEVVAGVEPLGDIAELTARVLAACPRPGRWRRGGLFRRGRQVAMWLADIRDLVERLPLLDDGLGNEAPQ